MPPELPDISVDPVTDATTGSATAATELPFVSIAVPAIVAPLGAGGGGPAAVPRAGTPLAPQTLGQRNAPAFTPSTGVPPASFRVVYGNFLRTAGVGQMLAIAIPGLVGILFLTGVGGVLGYRQARVGRDVLAGDTARFVG